jgi:hypothetical protein
MNAGGTQLYGLENSYTDDDPRWMCTSGDRAFWFYLLDMWVSQSFLSYLSQISHTQKMETILDSLCLVDEKSFLHLCLTLLYIPLMKFTGLSKDEPDHILTQLIKTLIIINS